MKNIQNNLKGDSLIARLVRGGVWLGSGSFLEQAARFGRNMLLTRLLVPEAFGTMAIVLSVSSAVESFTEIGVREAIIQNPRGREPEFLNSAWWIAFCRASGLYVVFFVCAPFVAHFYGNAQLQPLLRVALLGIVLTGAVSPGAYIAIKDMRFKRWAAINHGGGIAGVVLTVALALVRHDVWALVIGFCSECAFRCLISQFICPFRPTLKIDWSCVRELLSFSRRAVGLPFLNFIFVRADIFVIGKLFSAAILGLYSMAINVAQVPAGFVMNLLGQVLMPTYSHLQGDNRKVNEVLLRVTSSVVCLGLPIIVFVSVSARELLTLVYGARYSVMAPAFVLGSFMVLFNVLNAQITTVFYAKGVPNLHRRCVAIMALIVAILIYPAVMWLGITGAPIAGLVSVLVGYFFQIMQVRQLTGFPYDEYAKRFIPGILLAACVVGVHLGLTPFVRSGETMLSVFTSLLGCVVAYAVLLVTPLRRGMAASFEVH